MLELFLDCKFLQVFCDICLLGLTKLSNKPRYIAYFKFLTISCHINLWSCMFFCTPCTYIFHPLRTKMARTMQQWVQCCTMWPVVYLSFNPKKRKKKCLLKVHWSSRYITLSCYLRCLLMYLSLGCFSSEKIKGH